MMTSLKPDNPKHKTLIFKAAQSADYELMDCEGKEIRVQHLMITPATKVDEKTGEELDLVRVAVIDTDGKIYQSFGKGVAKSVELLVTIYGDPPWPDGISLTVRKVRCSVGYMPLLEPYVPGDPKPERRK